MKEKSERWDLKETQKREVGKKKKARRKKQALSLALLLLLGNGK